MAAVISRIVKQESMAFIVRYPFGKVWNHGYLQIWYSPVLDLNEVSTKDLSFDVSKVDMAYN